MAGGVWCVVDALSGVCLRRIASLLPLRCRPFSWTATDLECVEDVSTTQTRRSPPCSGHGLEITAHWRRFGARTDRRPSDRISDVTRTIWPPRASVLRSVSQRRTEAVLLNFGRCRCSVRCGGRQQGASEKDADHPSDGLACAGAGQAASVTAPRRAGLQLRPGRSCAWLV